MPRINAALTEPPTYEEFAMALKREPAWMNVHLYVNQGQRYIEATYAYDGSLWRWTRNEGFELIGGKQ